MNRPFKVVACLTVLIATCLVSRVALSRTDDKKTSAADQFEVLSRLEGTWESDKPGEDGKPQVVIFHTTSGKSVVMETMFPGSGHEMLNTYHLDGDALVMTHYCAMGNQPH